ncbi:DUF2283 domain-containing protein [Candidatus Pacearchaeota archaeon]|nr:DUF2283 domain-containing protein [Candidatus Pacearchaeota archaeon]
MAKENIIVNYDKQEDIISLIKEGKKVKFSLDLELPNGNFVVDYGFDGQIVGVEFFNASSYFPLLKDSEASNLKASMSIQYGPNWALVAYSIYLPGQSAPIISYIPAPYNKKLILEN